MQFLWAFIIGGLICVIGQIMMDVIKLTPAHTMSTLVVAGAIADGFGLYEPLVKSREREPPCRSPALVIRLCMAP